MVQLGSLRGLPRYRLAFVLPLAIAIGIDCGAARIFEGPPRSLLAFSLSLAFAIGIVCCAARLSEGSPV